jgi:predicted ATPase
MAKITIDYLGPIKHIEFDLNKVNVFMGQQSSGKSTVAKVISYCTWIEKDVAINQSLGEYNANGYFRKKLEEFHQLNGYFSNNTMICYESDIIKLRFENSKSVIEWVDQYAYKRSKIAYIPSDRNLITLPFIQKVEMPNNNNRSFLFDWLTMRHRYDTKNRVKILDLSVEYYFNKSAERNHIISTDKSNKYDIFLEDASSGLQSLTPLILALKYMTGWIYDNEEETSFEKQQKITKVSSQLMLELVIKKHYPEINLEDAEQFMKKVREVVDNRWMLEEFSNVLKNLYTTSITQFIIEEPEQNLFPSTQRDLVYYILQLITGERDHRLTITTHSPYILYALNNCMLGYLVKSQLSEGEKKAEYLANKFLSQNSWISPKLVSVWEIEDGTLRNIQDVDSIISENYFDKKMTELTDEYYQILNYYEGEDKDEE